MEASFPVEENQLLKEEWEMKMPVPQLILLIINIIGGIAVIGSYVLGLRSQAGGAAVLWGGVPESIRPVYTVSMVLAALGYFAFLYYTVIRLRPDEVIIYGRFGFAIFYLIFLAVLLPSAFWMPLTNLYVSQSAGALWASIRLVLILVGLGSLALLLALVTIQGKSPGTSHWLAVVGSGYFAFHTLVLDALIWPALFK
jgi:hypothetical protein